MFSTNFSLISCRCGFALLLLDSTVKLENWVDTAVTVSEVVPGKKSAMSEPPGLTYLFGVVSDISPSNGRAVPGLNEIMRTFPDDPTMVELLLKVKSLIVP